MVNVVIKNIPTYFAIIDSYEIPIENLMANLEQFHPHVCINNYDTDVTVADILVKIGVLTTEVGERMAKLYKTTDKFEAFYSECWENYSKLPTLSVPI